MRLKQPLKKRIVIAFFLMTLIVAGVSSISIFLIVHTLEEHFVSQGLSDNLEEILNSQMSRERIQKLSQDTDFYTTDSQVSYPIPEQFKNIKDGFSEVILREGAAYYVYKETIDQQSYLIVKDQTEFEIREQMLLLVVFLGFIGSLIVSLILGKLLANHILAPIIKLADQVDKISCSENKVINVTLNNQYAHDEVGQLAAAFDRAFGELQSALERERLFTSDVSHELRTPLMVIATSCELLLLEAKELSSVQSQQINRISAANKDMNELVQTFLMLARIENNPIVGDQITLLNLAKQLAEVWSAKFKEKGITFIFEVKSSTTNTYNKTLLKTVISNLLRNAWHYTEQGEVRLVIDDDSFFVQDTGIGVPQDKQQAIFQAFVRGSNRGEGLGLGLSLVKRICTHQHWQVYVISSEESGSIFSVTLSID
ncbi:HAMP domain-containing histidine kinase [Entomomonas sp. E2T0]|uniref:sensor histidine kinase n=1 Tax=Entomomonas sp. E2T0 TaxID=2930213 RepID=UPI00222832F0|nr:HAMP domain-containing sensor histidine kinase [Entomomonas sp. E2T0]UYZ85055.1 HAMP domain-containing histidine kinase [Entomomonas sp. E2T0]